MCERMAVRVLRFSAFVSGRAFTKEYLCGGLICHAAPRRGGVLLIFSFFLCFFKTENRRREGFTCNAR